MIVRGSNKMKLVTEIINNSILRRTIYSDFNCNLEAVAATVLIAYEYKWMKKVQVNIHSNLLSIHLEYANKSIRYYIRETINKRDNYLMTVSLIPEMGNAHTSTVSSHSILSCFNEYLLLSDQRQSSISRLGNSLYRIEQLPSSRLVELNGIIETVIIDLIT